VPRFAEATHGFDPHTERRNPDVLWPNPVVLFRQAASYVDKILKGACVTKSRRRYRGRRSNRTEASCIRDGGWPSGVALQGEAPNRRKLRRSRAGVVSVTEKSHSQCGRCEPRRRTQVNH
jgi:hypothetical protein